MKGNQWLTNITGIEEGTPYRCNITSGEEMPGDASPENIASRSMNGLAIFTMQDGWLHFNFTGDEENHPLAQSIIAKSPARVISIPSIGFTSNFGWTSLRGDLGGMAGLVLQSQMAAWGVGRLQIATSGYGQSLQSQRNQVEFETGITKSELVRL